VCGRRGCWEALTCNATTVDRYLARAEHDAAQSDAARQLGIDDVVRRARDGDSAAVEALVETARHLGRGLALVVNAFNPGRIYVGGEVTAAWELMERPIVDALEASTITARAASSPCVQVCAPAVSRLRGAVALVTAPGYAALAVG
jgi:predicted NBD/HSP70 family sugar kinase